MAEQQQATSPTPTVPTTPAATPPGDADIKFTGDVSGFMAGPVVEEEVAGAPDDAGEAAVPAPAEPEAPAGDDHQPADEVVDPDPSPEPADNQPPAVTEPEAAPATPDPVAEDATTQAEQRTARKAEVRAALKAVGTKLAALKAAGDVDPFAATTLQTEALILHAELSDIADAEVQALQQQEATRQQARGADDFWDRWKAEHPEVGDKGRKAFLEEETEAGQRFEVAVLAAAAAADPTNQRKAAAALGAATAASAFATARWETRVGLVKAHAEKAAASKAPVVPPPKKPAAPAGKGRPGGTPVVPPQSTPARPIVRPSTPEAQLAAKTGSAIRNFLS